MIPALFLVLASALVPQEGSVGSAPPVADRARLAAEYDRALEAFVAARRAAEEAGRPFAGEHPVRSFWPRFELLSRLGDGRATLWLLRHADERNLGEEGIVALKRGLLGELVETAAGEDWMVELVRALPEEQRWLSPRLARHALGELLRTSASESVRTAVRGRLLDGDYDRAAAGGTPADDLWLLLHAAELLAADPSREPVLLLALERSAAPAAEAAFAPAVALLWRSVADRPRLLRALYRYLRGDAPAPARARVASELADALLAEPGRPELREAAEEVYRFAASLVPDTPLGRRARERAARARDLGPGGRARELSGRSLDGRRFSLGESTDGPPWVVAFLRLDRPDGDRAARLLAELDPGRVVIVAADGDVEALVERRAAWPATWLVFASPEGELQRAWGVHGDQAVFVLEPDGLVLADLPVDRRLGPRLRALLGG